MKNASVVLNIFLLIAVGVLFYLHFSSNKTKVASKTNTSTEPAATQGRVAYFEMDSVINSFALVKDVKNELAKEEEHINRELNRYQKMYNDRIAQYQGQAQTMSQIESERANRDVLQLQETIRVKKQELDQKYQDLNMRKMQEVKTKIEDFLKEYNKSKGYSYILAYEQFIYYKDTMFDITADVVKGLNEQYKKK